MSKRFPDMVRRPDTLDDFIIGEVGCYEPLGMVEGDVVLDVGANIGAFTRLALTTGPHKVWAFEPDPENCRQFRQNVFQNCGLREGFGVSLSEAALIDGGGAGKKLPLFLNSGKNKGIHSLAPHRGRNTIDVYTHDWTEVLEEFKPTVVKVDIEGGEYTLNWGALPSSVRALAVELHLTKKPWREKSAPAVLQQILDMGFKVHPASKPDTSGQRWTSFYIFHRV